MSRLLAVTKAVIADDSAKPLQGAIFEYKET